MSADLLGLLWETTLSASAAILLALALRQPLRYLFGARSAYLVWLLVPAALIAVLVPAPVALHQPLAADLASDAFSTLASSSRSALPIDPSSLALLVWLAGVAAFARSVALRHGRFLRRIGQLRMRGDGSLTGSRPDLGPMVIGVWNARIVLPADFDERYDALERELVLRHESAHVARRDLAWNLLVTVLRAVYWFNPLFHLAAARFRFDQELAVDAVVLSQRPGLRRRYAGAMLKTLVATGSTPLACHWPATHPLKERIAMLKRPLPGALRAATGHATVALLMTGAAVAAWAAQPARIADSDTRSHAAVTNEGANADRTPAETRAAREILDGRSNSPPTYPSDAIQRGLSGTVILRVDVGADGRPAAIAHVPERGTPDVDPSLVTASRDAVEHWRFEPARDAEGRATTGSVLVPITFDVTRDPDSAPKEAPVPPEGAAEPGPAPSTPASGEIDAMSLSAAPVWTFGPGQVWHEQEPNC